jgi:chloride channel 3/4/5
MAGGEEHANEQTLLLPHNKRLGSVSARRSSDAESIISSHVSREELALGGTAVGERLAYSDYTTIDWLHDLVIQQTLANRILAATDTSTRSKTLFEFDQSITVKASAILYYLHGMHVKDGWPPRSSAH